MVLKLIKRRTLSENYFKKYIGIPNLKSKTKLHQEKSNENYRCKLKINQEKTVKDNKHHLGMFSCYKGKQVDSNEQLSQSQEIKQCIIHSSKNDDNSVLTNRSEAQKEVITDSSSCEQNNCLNVHHRADQAIPDELRLWLEHTPVNLHVHSNAYLGNTIDFERIIKIEADEFNMVDDLNLDSSIRQYIDTELVPYKLPIAFDAAYFVNDSIILSKLVDFGVCIYRWKPAVLRSVIMIDFDTVVAPIVQYFINELSLNQQDIAKIISYNPKLLLPYYSTHYIKEHVDYLVMKQFDLKTCGQLFSGGVKWLANSIIKSNRLVNILGFSENQVKMILLTSPDTYLTEQSLLMKNFDFLYNESIK
ncbi:hypothetical protein GJ496_006303 [Pomphorhynchus laevis]|nr:hypothetical protein GJ496_006303 [Pomphorhynchus laevis]